THESTVVELIPATRRSRCVGVEATAARYNGGDDGDASFLPLPVTLIAGNLFSNPVLHKLELERGWKHPLHWLH
ncbi:unnamed protein product, partial [Urochloa humidicola]